MSTRVIVLPAAAVNREDSAGSVAGVTGVEIRLPGVAHLLGETWRTVLARGRLLPFRSWSRLVVEEGGPGRDSAAYLEVVERWAGRVGAERVRLVVEPYSKAGPPLDGAMVDACVSELAGSGFPERRAARILADAFRAADLSAVAAGRAAEEARSWVERMALGVAASGVVLVGDPSRLRLPEPEPSDRPVPLSAAVTCATALLRGLEEPAEERARRVERVHRLRDEVDARAAGPLQDVSGREALAGLTRRAAHLVRRSGGRIGRPKDPR